MPAIQASCTTGTFTSSWFCASSTVLAWWVTDSYNMISKLMPGCAYFYLSITLTYMAVFTSPFCCTITLIWPYTSPTMQARWLTNSCSEKLPRTFILACLQKIISNLLHTAVQSILQGTNRYWEPHTGHHFDREDYIRLYHTMQG